MQLATYIFASILSNIQRSFYSSNFGMHLLIKIYMCYRWNVGDEILQGRESSSIMKVFLFTRLKNKVFHIQDGNSDNMGDQH